MANSKEGRSAQEWGDKVTKYLKARDEVQAITLPNDSYGDEPFDPENTACEMIFDHELRERLVDSFGPLAYNVMNTLYGGFESEDARLEAINVLQANISGSPWSSSFYQDPADVASEQLRFLLKTYIPGQINPVGKIFDEERQVADSLR
ncbi:MAG: hypothetical protein WBO77_02925 [Microgenomates group bacterium]